MGSRSLVCSNAKAKAANYAKQKSTLQHIQMAEPAAKKTKVAFSASSALEEKAAEFKCAISDEKFALEMDKQDKLRALRNDFAYPKAKDIPTTDCRLQLVLQLGRKCR